MGGDEPRDGGGQGWGGSEAEEHMGDVAQGWRERDTRVVVREGGRRGKESGEGTLVQPITIVIPIKY